MDDAIKFDALAADHDREELNAAQAKVRADEEAAAKAASEAVAKAEQDGVDADAVQVLSGAPGHGASGTIGLVPAQYMLGALKAAGFKLVRA